MAKVGRTSSAQAVTRHAQVALIQAKVDLTLLIYLGLRMPIERRSRFPAKNEIVSIRSRMTAFLKAHGRILFLASGLIATLVGCDEVQSETFAEIIRFENGKAPVEDRQQPGLEALARPEALLRQRYAEVRVILPFDAILEVGQPPPPREQQDAYVAKRPGQ